MSTTPYKQARVDGTSNGYIISNGVSGFYHTGSRSKLYSNDDDDSRYLQMAPQVPPKLKHMLGEEITTRDYHGSVFSKFTRDIIVTICT